MPRRKTGRRRGRPRKLHAKRRATTRIGRRTGRDPVDDGTAQLRYKKRQLTTRIDLPLDSAAVLYGHAHLDRQQFDTLGMITELLQRVARAWGGKDGSVSGLWSALLGAAVSTKSGGAIVVPVGADAARYRLARVLRLLDGSRDLIVAVAEGRCPPLIRRVVEGNLTNADEASLEWLRADLDAISGRRTT